MALNLLTGQNVDPQMAINYDWGTVWFFIALYKKHRRLLERLAHMDAIGAAVLPGKLHKAVITELRRVYATENRLLAMVDAAWGPHIDRVNAEEDGRKTWHLVNVTRLLRAPGTTMTAPDPDGIVKRRRGRPAKTATKGGT